MELSGSMSFLIRWAVVIILCLSTTKAYNIQCEIESDPSWLDLPGSLCKVSTKISGACHETVTTVNVQNAAYYCDQDIQQIWIEPNMVSCIPKGLGSFFPRIEYFAARSCDIKSIQQEDLKQFPNLRRLYLEGNKIETLSADLFTFNPAIRYIYIDNNQIKFVGKDILKPLVKLKVAYLIGNVCINKFANTENEVAALAAELNSKCSKENFDTLKIEKIHPNGIVVLTCDTTSNQTCVALSFVVTSSTSIIEEVKDEKAKEIATATIKRLRIVEQSTLYLPMNLAETFPQLRKLTVTSSGLLHIASKVLANLPLLTMLDLKGNKIYDVPKSAFESSENLVELDLSFNTIEKIETGAFQALGKLKKLHLNDNIVSTIGPGIFDTMKSLKDLTLHNNKLKFIDADLLQPLINLQSADLSNNTCISMKYPSDTLEEISSKIFDSCVEPK